MIFFSVSQNNFTILPKITKMPSCSENCVFFRPVTNNFPPPPVLVRSTHRICSTANCAQNVSNYDHNYCYHCAQPGSVEFTYHHSRCANSQQLHRFSREMRELYNN